MILNLYINHMISSLMSHDIRSDDHYIVQLSIDDTNINNVIEDMVYPINSLKPSLPPVSIFIVIN